jgi:hypothetical protein
MRVLLIHPHCHSGGAEIAGNWRPAWAAYLTGYLKTGGYGDVQFVDSMTHHLDDEAVRARIAQLRPDIVGCTASCVPELGARGGRWPFRLRPQRRGGHRLRGGRRSGGRHAGRAAHR